MRAIDLTWAGGEDSFLLTIDLLRALEQRCDAGPMWILARLANQQWRVDDVVSTIRYGIEGGGMSKDAARKKVQQYVEDRPLSLSVLTAQAILMAALYDHGDDRVGEATGEAATATPTFPAESGAGAGSTE